MCLRSSAAMTLEMLDDPVQWVLAHPERFFRNRTPNTLELVQSIWMDATLSGVSDVLVHHEDEVWVVAGSANWLIEGNLTGADLFVRVVPVKAGGPNSMRSEILLNAFCAHVVAVVAGSPIFAKGGSNLSAPMDRVLQRWPTLEVAVGFRL